MEELGESGRHAYLIMAHNEFEFLVEVLKELDDKRNDLYLHVDKKACPYPKERIKNSVTKGNLFIIDAMNVNWGGYSQIACELLLMEKSVAKGPYQYYHMLTGVTYPIKSQEYIHRYFDEHQGYEFVGFDKRGDYSYRVTKIHLFNEIGKITTPSRTVLHKIRGAFLMMQQAVGYNRKETHGYDIKKGLVYWSLTEEAVRYILSQKEIIYNMFRYSVCGDEVFVHTILSNSPFRSRLFPVEEELDACMREVKPPLSYGHKASKKRIFEKRISQQENVYVHADMDVLLNSNRLFAYKFGGPGAAEFVREFKGQRDARTSSSG